MESCKAKLRRVRARFSYDVLVQMLYGLVIANLQERQYANAANMQTGLDNDRSNYGMHLQMLYGTVNASFKWEGRAAGDWT